MVTCVTIRNLCVTKGCLERSWLCGSFIDCEWSSDTKRNWIELFEVITTCSDFLAGLGSLWVSLYDWSSLLCRTGWVFTPHLFKLRSSLRWYSLLNICTKYSIALYSIDFANIICRHIYTKIWCWLRLHWRSFWVPSLLPLPLGRHLHLCAHHQRHHGPHRGKLPGAAPLPRLWPSGRSP